MNGDAMTELPAPKFHDLGYTEDELTEILGDKREAFGKWMWCQTVAAHPDLGLLTYPRDVKRFLAGLPVID